MAPGRSLASMQGATGRSCPVPHAAHFLERLDRVPRCLTDLALGLYRDPERVRWILRYAHLPAGDERVAFALDPDSRGPFIVVTRDGHFVTALAAGMKTGGLIVLPRAQVDTFSDRVQTARARKELAREIVPPGKEAEDVLRLLDTRAWSLSREEFTAMAGWVPILDTGFYREAVERLQKIEPIRTKFLARRERSFRGDKRARPAMNLVCSSVHAIGTRFALSAMGDVSWSEKLAAIWSAEVGPTFFATSQRIHSVAMRGAWAAARLGPPFLPLYQRILETPGDVLARFDAALAVTAMGVRDPTLRDDARRLVASMVRGEDDATREWTREVIAASEQALFAPEEASSHVADYGAETFILMTEHWPEGSRYRFARASDVPRELALLAAANSFHDSGNVLAVKSLAWVASLASAEELYFPAELEQSVRFEWPLDFMDRVFSRRLPPKPTPVLRDAAHVGRNAPCSCGSGAKYKRCCGR